jgi:hypothetical protein
MSWLQDRRQVAELLHRWGGTFHLRDADAAGISRAVIRRCWQRDELVRVGKSAFAGADAWSAATPKERFRLSAVGFGLCTADDVHLAGTAAAALHDIPTVGPPPAVPTAVRPGDAHRAPIRSVHGRIRWGYLPPAHRTTRSRVGVVSPAYTLIDIARHESPLAGLTAADHLFHHGLHPEVHAGLLPHMSAYPGIQQAAWVLEHADGRCESPLETAGRYVFIQAGMPVPLSNVWVTDGSRVRRVDHLIAEHGIVIEGDGDVKYDNRPDAAAIVTDEKARERWLRSLGFIVIRYTHEIVRYRPQALLAEVRREITNRGGRPVPTCWSLEPPRAMAG